MKNPIRIQAFLLLLLMSATAPIVAQRGQSPAAVPPPPTLTPQDYPAGQVAAGEPRFVARCGFCHGRDAGGGEGGPDLTRSEVVAADVYGDRIGELLRAGLADGNVHALDVPPDELANIVAFVHDRKRAAELALGGRRFVEAEDMRTGDADAGAAYFNGQGQCSRCHSVTGDLAGIGSRFEGLNLMRRLLYPAFGQPSPAPATLTVTLGNGETVTGPLVDRSEFIVALEDTTGQRREFATDAVEYTIDDPFEEHFDLLGVYSDQAIHDLFAYLETLR
jgi:cytochrome c oxidase cbb3-type subunit 3